MNTEQKARDWIAKVENFESPNGAFEIIRALLAERKAKEYPESVAGQVSVFRLNANELTVEFTYSKEFKAEYLKCLEIGQEVRVPVYTHPPKTAEPVACRYFWSGASGHFYTNTLEQGEMIVKHLPDSDDYTATELTTPKPDPRKAELVKRIDESTSHYQPDESITDLLKDIRDYLEGK